MADFNFDAGGNIHRIPDGMLKPAGRISDGAFYGRFSYPGADQWNVTTKYGTIDVFVRTFKGFAKPIAEVKQYGPNMPNPPQVAKAREFFEQWVGTLTGQFKTLADLGQRVASKAELQSLGSDDGQLLPMPSTGLPINWQVDDNGYLKPYLEPADPNAPLKELAAQNQKLFDKIAAQFAGGDAGNAANPATGSGVSMAQMLRIGAWVLGAAAVIAVVIVIFRAVRG